MDTKKYKSYVFFRPKKRNATWGEKIINQRQNVTADK